VKLEYAAEEMLSCMLKNVEKAGYAYAFFTGQLVT